MQRRTLVLSSIVLFGLICFPLTNSVGAPLEMLNQTYGETTSDVAYSLVETTDGGFALAGSTQPPTIELLLKPADFWLVKTDANGVVEWNRTYGGAGFDVAYSLVETSDGGFALAGFTRSFGAGYADFWLVKTGMYGNVEWSRTHGGAMPATETTPAPEPTLTPKPTPIPEPFTTTLLVAASVVTITVVVAVLLLYFRKRKN